MRRSRCGLCGYGVRRAHDRISNRRRGARPTTIVKPRATVRTSAPGVSSVCRGPFSLMDRDQTSIKIEVTELRTHDFRSSGAGMCGENKHRINEGLACPGLHGLQQFLDFTQRKKYAFPQLGASAGLTFCARCSTSAKVINGGFSMAFGYLSPLLGNNLSIKPCWRPNSTRSAR